MERLSSPEHLDKVKSEILRIYGDQYRALSDQERENYRDQHNRTKDFFRRKRTSAYSYYIKKNMALVELKEGQNKEDRLKMVADNWKKLSPTEQQLFKTEAEQTLGPLGEEEVVAAEDVGPDDT